MVRLESYRDLMALPAPPLSGEFVEWQIRQTDGQLIPALMPIEHAWQIKTQGEFVHQLIADGTITLNPQTITSPAIQLALFESTSTGVTVYFISDGEAIRIGRTDRPVDTRRREHQGGNPRSLTTLIAIPGASEERLHQRFRPYLIHGSWYRMAPEIMDFIQAWRLVESAF